MGGMVGVGIGVDVDVGVGIGADVNVGVGVAVAVGVDVDVAVAAGVDVHVAVGVAVAVDVAVGVAVGVAGTTVAVGGVGRRKLGKPPATSTTPTSRTAMAPSKKGVNRSGLG